MQRIAGRVVAVSLPGPRAVAGVAAVDVVDVVVVGAGFAGLQAVYALGRAGWSVQGFDAAPTVGGVWYWNRYPGARCDIESLDYSYGFSEQLQQDWTWSQQYPTQPEILAYAEHVADRFDLRRHFRFGTRVESMVFDEAAGVWDLRTDDEQPWAAQHCVMATGPLSAVKYPDFPGLANFRGQTYLTARWPEQPADFRGRRVAVVGTGSSGIQTVPVIACEAAHVTVFQRTANFSIRGANQPLAAETVARVRANYAEFRRLGKLTRDGTHLAPNPRRAAEMTPAAQRAELERRWQLGGFAYLGAFADLRLDEHANDIAAEFVRERIREVVEDPAVAQLLTPHTHPIGTKRICVDTGYYEAFNRDNVTLVDISSSPIQRISETGVVVDGIEHEVDAIVFALGFDALTGALTRIDVRGREGRSLADKWAPAPRTYLGLMTAGFPNLFHISGPGSPSVLANAFVQIDHHVELITGLLQRLAELGGRVVEAAPTAEATWFDQVQGTAHRTLYEKAESWYMGANIPGKTRTILPYLGGMNEYRARCEEIVEDGYRGFLFDGAGDGAARG